MIAARLTQSTVAGVLAGLAALALEPRLYSVPKVLVPAIGLLLISAYAATPSRRGLVWLAVWTTVAGLLRHDLGALYAIGVLVGLVVAHFGDWSKLGPALAVYAAVLALTVMPYAAFVQLTEGLGEHLRVGLEMSKTDAHQIITEWPALPYLAPDAVAWSRPDSAVFLFVAARVLPVLGLFVLIWRRRALRRPGLAVFAAACAMLAAYDAFILRHPIEARIPDLAALLVVVAAGVCMSPLGRTAMARSWRMVGLGGLIGLMAAAGHMDAALERLDDAQVWRGFEKMRARAAAAREEASVWPWERFWSQGELPPVIEYLDRCTQPTDRVFVAWFAPDYYYFSRRRMAGGLNVFYPSRAFKSATDQSRFIQRMESARPPIVLVHADRDSLDNTPAIAAYVRTHYSAAGRFKTYDGAVVTLHLRGGLVPQSTYGPDRWPCGFPAERRTSR